MAVLGHQFAPPNDDCVPAEVTQLDAFFYVALFVAFYLLLPELAITLGQYEVFAVFVAMPETAVDKYCGFVLAQYYVWGTGQALDVYTVAVAMGVWICRVFIIFLLHLVWVTAWKVLTL